MSLNKDVKLSVLSMALQHDDDIEYEQEVYIARMKELDMDGKQK